MEKKINKFIKDFQMLQACIRLTESSSNMKRTLASSIEERNKILKTLVGKFSIEELQIVYTNETLKSLSADDNKFNELLEIELSCKKKPDLVTIYILISLSHRLSIDNLILIHEVYSDNTDLNFRLSDEKSIELLKIIKKRESN